MNECLFVLNVLRINYNERILFRLSLFTNGYDVSLGRFKCIIIYGFLRLVYGYFMNYGLCFNLKCLSCLIGY